jgi:hypothetical protein
MTMYKNRHGIGKEIWGIVDERNVRGRFSLGSSLLSFSEVSKKGRQTQEERKRSGREQLKRL